MVWFLFCCERRRELPMGLPMRRCSFVISADKGVPSILKKWQLSKNSGSNPLHHPAAADTLGALELCNSSAQDPLQSWGKLLCPNRLLAHSRAPSFLWSPPNTILQRTTSEPHGIIFLLLCLCQGDFFRRKGNRDYKAV